METPGEETVAPVDPAPGVDPNQPIQTPAEDDEAEDEDTTEDEGDAE